MEKLSTNMLLTLIIDSGNENDVRERLIKRALDRALKSDEQHESKPSKPPKKKKNKYTKSARKMMKDLIISGKLSDSEIASIMQDNCVEAGILDNDITRNINYVKCNREVYEKTGEFANYRLYGNRGDRTPEGRKLVA